MLSLRVSLQKGQSEEEEEGEDVGNHGIFPRDCSQDGIFTKGWSYFRILLYVFLLAVRALFLHTLLYFYFMFLLTKGATKK